MRFARAVLLATVALLLLAAGPALAQTFVFGAQGEPVQFDPAVITDGISAKITRQIFDTLYEFKPGKTEVQPALAEKAEVSADGKVWTLQLRKNVKFHDGEPFDAKAVVWNFERWMNTKHPQHENQLKAGQTFEYFEGQFDGFDDKSVIAKVEATGSSYGQVHARSSRRRPSSRTSRCFPFAIASPKAVEKWGTDYGKHPVGTGAFKFVEWKPNQEAILEANPDYWGKKPSVKRVVVRNIKDNSQRVAALKAGEVHADRGHQPRRPEGHQGGLEPPGAAPPDQHHRLRGVQLQGEGVPGQARAPGDRPRDQQEGDRRRASTAVRDWWRRSSSLRRSGASTRS